MVNPVWHQLWDFSRLLGLRDRLRCPECRAVGTWKPHGGWLDREDTRKVRRWMCKWCGLYQGPEDWNEVVVGPTCWVLSCDYVGTTDTPREVVTRAFGRPVSPWRG